MDLSSFIGGGFAGINALTVAGHTVSGETVITAKKEVRYKRLSYAVFRQWQNDGADPADFDPRMKSLFETILYPEELDSKETTESGGSALTEYVFCV